MKWKLIAWRAGKTGEPANSGSGNWRSSTPSAANAASTVSAAAR
jgi:hypothetical protein